MAKILGWRVQGTLRDCTPCLQGKARQADTKKISNRVAETPGKRILVDLTGPFEESTRENKYLFGARCQKTGRTWHKFQRTKNQLATNLDQLMTKLSTKGFGVKFVQFDWAGENQAIDGVCKKHGAKAEHVPTDSPELNSTIKRAFPTAKNKATACLENAKLDEIDRKKLWAHAIDDVLVIQGLSPTKGYDNAYQPFNKEVPLKAKHLIPWGTMGKMTIKGKQPNFAPKSECVQRVGYNLDCPSATYLVQKIGTNKSFLHNM
ncbi:hypothetical protein ACA910_012744 [Epithemia clementina (nom. ined.)]